MAVDAPTCQHQSTVDMEPEAPMDPALHAARLFYGLRRGDGTVFRSPRFLHSDHRAIVMNIRVRRTGWLKKYWRARQKFPLSLPPEPKDANTALFDFDALAACVEPKQMWAPGKETGSHPSWSTFLRYCFICFF